MSIIRYLNSFATYTSPKLYLLDGTSMIEQSNCPVSLSLVLDFYLHLRANIRILSLFLKTTLNTNSKPYWNQCNSSIGKPNLLNGVSKMTWLCKAV